MCAWQRLFDKFKVLYEAAYPPSLLGPGAGAPGVPSTGPGRALDVPGVGPAAPGPGPGPAPGPTIVVPGTIDFLLHGAMLTAEPSFVSLLVKTVIRELRETCMKTGKKPQVRSNAPAHQCLLLPLHLLAVLSRIDSVRFGLVCLASPVGLGVWWCLTRRTSW